MGSDQMSYVLSFRSRVPTRAGPGCVADMSLAVDFLEGCAEDDDESDPESESEDEGLPVVEVEGRGRSR